MGTQIRVKMEELQSIFAETKNALALGNGSALVGREAHDPSRKAQTTADHEGICLLAHLDPIYIPCSAAFTESFKRCQKLSCALGEASSSMTTNSYRRSAACSTKLSQSCQPRWCGTI